VHSINGTLILGKNEESNAQLVAEVRRLKIKNIAARATVEELQRLLLMERKERLAEYAAGYNDGRADGRNNQPVPSADSFDQSAQQTRRDWDEHYEHALCDAYMCGHEY
jgi:hypothetical protein